MQKHQQQEPQPATPMHSPALNAAQSLNTASDSLLIDAGLNAYLEAVAAQMPSDVPAQSVQDMCKEMRGHLQASIVACAEMGMTEEAALSHALTQFGKPEVVARQWRQEWKQTLASTREPSFWSSLRPVLGVWAGVYASLLILGEMLRHFPAMIDVQRAQITLLGVFALPLLGGAAAGLLAKHRPVLCNAAALAAMLPLYLLVIIAQLNAISPNGWQSALWFAVNPFLMWLPLSSISAAITSQLRRFALRRQIAR